MTLLTVPEVAARFRVAKSTAYGWVGEGILPSIRVGGCVRVPAEALERWIEERTDGGTTAPGMGRRFDLSPERRTVDRARRVAKGTRRPTEADRPRTVSHHLACLRTALAAAVRDELVPRNVATLVSAPRVPRVERPTLTESDVTALLEAVKGDRLEALYVLAAATGMRQGELLGLEWSAVDLEKAEVHVRQSMSWVDRKPSAVPPKTERSRRTIPIEPSIVEAMRAHRKRSLSKDPGALEQGLVFATEAGSPIVGWRATKALQAHLRDAGLPPLGFHALRHACASRWATRGMAPRLLMGLLGHANIATTMDVYSHVTTDDIREAMRRLA